MKHRHIVILIIALAFFVRVVGLGNFPSGFTQDEAGIGYEAYSILKTGKDSWGQSIPLTLRSFGDFKLPLYSYLSIPIIAIFGLEIFSVRLLSVIFGTLSVLATYLLTLELSKSKRLSRWSAFLMAISPWSVSLSRGAFEANLTTFIIPFATWLFIKQGEKGNALMLSAILFGLNLFSYHSARIFTVIYVVVLLIFFVRRNQLFNQKHKLHELFYASTVFIGFLLIAGLTMFFGASKRGLDVSIFNPTDKWSYVSERRYEAVLSGIPDQISRIFSNKVIYVFSKTSKTYISYLSPNFLFSEGAGEWTYGMISGRGVLYFIEFSSVLTALILLIKRPKEKNYLSFILVWILISPIAVSISKNVGYAANRITVMMPAIQILSATGVVILLNKTQEMFSSKYKKYVEIGFFIVFLLSFVFFIEDYYFHAPYKQGKDMHYGINEAVEVLKNAENDYDEIYLSRSLSVPSIWIQFFGKIDPKIVQAESVNWLEYERQGKPYLDQLDPYKLNQYVFGTVDVEKIKAQDKRAILLIGPKEISKDIVPVKTIYYKNGEKAYLIVDSNDL